MEYQRLDRMSFQRFAGLRDTGRIPDRNTLRVFRERLVQAKVEYLIFDEVQRQLQQQGFMARGTTDHRRQHCPGTDPVQQRRGAGPGKAQTVPAEWSPAKRRQKDIQARWAKRHGHSYFGYKLSVSVDRRHKLIRRVKVSERMPSVRSFDFGRSYRNNDQAIAVKSV